MLRLWPLSTHSGLPRGSVMWSRFGRRESSCGRAHSQADQLDAHILGRHRLYDGRLLRGEMKVFAASTHRGLSRLRPVSAKGGPFRCALRTRQAKSTTQEPRRSFGATAHCFPPQMSRQPRQRSSETGERGMQQWRTSACPANIPVPRYNRRHAAGRAALPSLFLRLSSTCRGCVQGL